MAEGTGEEEDYMSDAFLKQLEDIRPGLRTKNQKRKGKDIFTKHENPPKQKKKMAENKARECAMSIPLSDDNKGFSLLKKMGYKKGMGLGKSGEGRTAPVPIVVKDDRVGLGRQRFLQERKVLKRAEEVRSVDSFRQRKLEKFSLRQIETDIRRSQLACEQLDSNMGYEPERTWFWLRQDEAERYDQDDSSGEDECEEDALGPTEKLSLITEYLRSQHFYCIWCGTAYEDTQDMDQNCPGDSKDVHE